MLDAYLSPHRVLIDGMARKQIDNLRRSFLWKEDENANGGHCLVNWSTVCRPKELGGLGVENFGRALCLRWLWQEWVHDSKPWTGTSLPCNDIDRLLFNVSTTITIGNGNKARFWHHNWLEGSPKIPSTPSFWAGTPWEQDGSPGTTKWQLDPIPQATYYNFHSYTRIRRL
jgi:hypothetical protein